MGVDSERNTHLSQRKRSPIRRLDLGVSVKHPDVSLIREVNLGLISHITPHIAGKAETGITHLETPRMNLRLVLIFCPDRSVDFGQIVFETPGLRAVGSVSRLNKTG